MASNSYALKQFIRERILAYIYTQHGTTQKEIKDDLGLSRPTVTQILKEFEEQGLIVKGEPLESTGGRRANSSFSPARPSCHRSRIVGQPLRNCCFGFIWRHRPLCSL